MMSVTRVMYVTTGVDDGGGGMLTVFMQGNP